MLLKDFPDTSDSTTQATLVKENQEKDKIGSKPDKNGKRAPEAAFNMLTMRRTRVGLQEGFGFDHVMRK
nr:hypothetical protein [Tanacetum cinerariifolium]